MDNHFTHDDGKPAGGISTGVGYVIAWQNGPCPMLEDGSQPGRNGAFLIEVLESCESRLDSYQASEFVCEENARALYSLRNAIAHLKERLNRRKDAGILGTHTKDQEKQS